MIESAYAKTIIQFLVPDSRRQSFNFTRISISLPCCSDDAGAGSRRRSVSVNTPPSAAGLRNNYGFSSPADLRALQSKRFNSDFAPYLLAEDLIILVISLIASVILLVVANVLYRRGKRGAACAVSGLAIFAGLPCFLLPGLMLTGAAMAIGGLICISLEARSSGFLRWSLTAFVASHFVLGINAFLLTKERMELAAKYPIESMEARLAYKSLQKPSAQHPDLAPLPVLSQGAVKSELSELEMRIESNPWRDFHLMFLHDSAVYDFINSPGFGVARRMEPRREYIELPEPAPIPLPAPDEEGTYKESGSPAPPKLSAAQPVPLSKQSLLDLHNDGFLDFVNPKGFGNFRDRQHVRGFQAHHFHDMPGVARPPVSMQRWQIQRLELVSLLMHEEPAVYLSDHLPRMDELRDAPTRRLRTFETEALAALQRGDDLRFQASADRIDMLGSIRALNQCLTCHDAERGRLLGAFSYTLKRVESP